MSPVGFSYGDRSFHSISFSLTEIVVMFLLPHSLVHSSLKHPARRFSSSVLNSSRDRGDRSGLRRMEWAGETSQRRRQERSWLSQESRNRVLWGQSPHWPFCSFGKGSSQSPFSLPRDPEGRGLWNCQVISGLGFLLKLPPITARGL